MAAFLTDLQLDPPSEESASSTEDSGSSSSSSDKPFRKSPRTGSEPFTATLTLRRIAGAPNFVIADSEKQQRVMRRGSQLMKEMEGQPQGAAAKAAASAAAAAAVGSLLGPPMGLVRFDSPVEALGKAIDREVRGMMGPGRGGACQSAGQQEGGHAGFRGPVARAGQHAGDGAGRGEAFRSRFCALVKLRCTSQGFN